MASVSLSLQKAIVAALKGDVIVSSMVGANVYDTPNVDTFPRVTLGEDQVIPQYAQCYTGDEVIITIHVWSRAVGFPEAKRIAAAIRAALDDADLILDGFRLVLLHIEGERFIRETDGQTSHAVLTFRALTEPTD